MVNGKMHSTSTMATAPQDLWTAALERLEPRYNKPVFEMWLKPMRLVDLTPSEIVLAVQTRPMFLVSRNTATKPLGTKPMPPATTSAPS